MNRHLILFDIDGVCADDSGRIHYALDRKWADYFSRAWNDKPLADGLALAKLMDAEGEVQYLTGRRVDMYQMTTEWLSKHGFPNPERITMRGFADRDILCKYKAGVIKNALEGGEYDSVTLYEDDPAVVEHINSVFGDGTAFLTTWYTKHPQMVKTAKS